MIKRIEAHISKAEMFILLVYLRLKYRQKILPF